MWLIKKKIRKKWMSKNWRMWMKIKEYSHLRDKEDSIEMPTTLTKIFFLFFCKKTNCFSFIQCTMHPRLLYILYDAFILASPSIMFVMPSWLACSSPSTAFAQWMWWFSQSANLGFCRNPKLVEILIQLKPELFNYYSQAINLVYPNLGNRLLKAFVTDTPSAE